MPPETSLYAVLKIWWSGPVCVNVPGRLDPQHSTLNAQHGLQLASRLEHLQPVSRWSPARRDTSNTVRKAPAGLNTVFDDVTLCG
jgi:hypothetical protein